MRLVKIKLPPFLTNVEKEEFCLVVIYINAQIVWAGRCNCLAKVVNVKCLCYNRVQSAVDSFAGAKNWRDTQ